MFNHINALTDPSTTTYNLSVGLYQSVFALNWVSTIANPTQFAG